MGDRSDDAVWVATMKADALLGHLSDEYRVQLGARFDWDVSEEDVRVARATLSAQRIDALTRGQRKSSVASVSTAGSGPAVAGEWDLTNDLLAL
ncbi:hypothetical protein ELQ92_02065 [Labedella populi]|uniref:Uncharacterized protein n=1 Tax=Labedella populi TaxID=2498850 RepID=A0A3S3ZWD6_9MICO|nr:hypothetical protein [Labedella populi]RWZ68062.1 hypothetical protein ELQ92_02065 [Labedella populi]